MKLKCDDCENEATTVLLLGGKAVPVNIVLCADCRKAHPITQSFNEMAVGDFITRLRT